MSQPPLTGIKVLDFTHLLPGELCATLLSDMGAEVLRIESPVRGLAHKLPPVIKGESLFYWSMQRNKARLNVDLKRKEGNDLVKRLIGDFDIVVENFRPGVMQRLGLGFDVLSELNPRLIYISISGYGHDSPRRDAPSHDLNLVAETGILSLNCHEHDRPVLPAIPIGDYMSGMIAALSCLAALLERSVSGAGRSIDISMSDCTLSALNVLGSCVLYTGKTPAEAGFAYPKELPNYNVYLCADGRYLAVACLEAPFWSEFCRIIGRPDLEPLLADRHRYFELTELIAAVIKEKNLADWAELFKDSNCCVSPVKTAKEAFDSYPLDDRKMISQLQHPLLGNIPQIIFPVDLSLRKLRESGGDSDPLDMLNKAGFTGDQIDKLIESKVIALPVAVNK